MVKRRIENPVAMLIVDDHAMVRRGVRSFLEEAFPDAAIVEASTADGMPGQLAARPWSLVILDITMPGRDGLDTLGMVRATAPDVPVLVLSAYAEEQLAIRALRAGAIGYITSDCTPDELITATHKALSGGMYVTAHLAEVLARNVNARGRLLHETLSDREFQVLCLLAAGKSVKQIGVELALSDKTISTYRARVLDKLGMSSNAELVRYALKMRLVD
jgi:two-component system invasion response regulator UvrY